ncbi:MAG TPA: hypothetical protein VG318_11545 [Actinomycetota bacterium]|nr:hypothetical protein [Actinomycetota bacterium]
MRKKLSLVAAGLLAGATISMAAAPAQAQPQSCSSNDPVLAFVCSTLDKPGPWIQHYYEEAGKAVYYVYCTLWDPTC